MCPTFAHIVPGALGNGTGTLSVSRDSPWEEEPSAAAHQVCPLHARLLLQLHWVSRGWGTGSDWLLCIFRVPHPTSPGPTPLVTRSSFSLCVFLCAALWTHCSLLLPPRGPFLGCFQVSDASCLMPRAGGKLPSVTSVEDSFEFLRFGVVDLLELLIAL